MIPIGIANGITSAIVNGSLLRSSTDHYCDRHGRTFGAVIEQLKMSDPRCISRTETPINKRIYPKWDRNWDRKRDRKIIAKHSHHNHHHNHHHNQAFANAKAAVVSPSVLERGDEI